MEQYADLIESAERLSEGLELQALLRSMPSHIEEDSEWFFLPKKWLDRWETWCYVDIINATSPADENSISELRDVERKKPGKIDFSGLFLPKDKDQITEQLVKVKWQNHQIRPGQQEGVDFMLVTHSVIAAFIDRYRSVDFDPMKSFKRVGVVQDDGEVVCELQMRRINFLALPNESGYKMKKPWFCYVPKSDTVG